MTRTCCRPCRLRFDPFASACLTACPRCGEMLRSFSDPEKTLGFRLYTREDALCSLPEAVAVSLPVPTSLGDRL